MTQDEIIEMAREAGFDTSKPNRIIVRHSNGSWISIKFELEAFAKLVAAAEREACAKVADQISDKYAIGYYGSEVDAVDEVADAIRARGNQC